jgi:hypothetical protein
MTIPFTPAAVATSLQSQEQSVCLRQRTSRDYLGNIGGLLWCQQGGSGAFMQTYNRFALGLALLHPRKFVSLFRICEDDPSDFPPHMSRSPRMAGRLLLFFLY